MPYFKNSRNYYIMKNPFDPFYKDHKIYVHPDSQLKDVVLLEGLKSVSKSIFIWRWIFYYFIFEKNHKRIYDGILSQKI